MVAVLDEQGEVLCRSSPFGGGGRAELLASERRRRSNGGAENAHPEGRAIAARKVENAPECNRPQHRSGHFADPQYSSEGRIMLKPQATPS